MAISRSQMKRQLYEGGGISTLEQAKDVLEAQALPGEFLAYINPQEAAMLKYMGGAGIPINSSGVPSFFIKKIAKGVKSAVKGAAGAVKDIVSSDVGKLALTAAGVYALGGGFGAGGFKLGNLPGAGFFGKGSLNPLKALSVGGEIMQSPFGSMLSSVGIPTSLRGATDLISGKTALLGAGILGGAALATEVFGSPQAAQEAYQRDPEMVKMYLKQYYRNINPDASDQEVEQFAASQLAEYGAKQDLADGGRVGFEEGGTFLTMEEAAERDPAMFMDTTTYNPIPADADRQSAAEIARIMMGISDFPREDEMEDDTMSSTEFVYNEYLIPKRRELMENFGLSLEEADELIKEEMTKLRTKKADGGMPNGIMRTNQAGIMERDYREDGGFVPVGIKEKADDVPAMLSKNEFVFTADAVRGAGNGDVEKGAQRMYRIMKTLENGGQI
jgi:hypothetical protein